MPYYLGIDGGGTKTRCALADETTLLATAISGGSNMIRLGETHARDALHAAIRQVCATAKIAPAQIHAICIGAAGADRPEIAAKIRSILAELISEIAPEIALTKIEVVGDMTIALEAACGAGPGVIAIAGTGSIAYGRDATGHTARAGGWGFAVSDEGSGHWIGRRAISAILSAHDQGLETTLSAMVLQVGKPRGHRRPPSRAQYSSGHAHGVNAPGSNAPRSNDGQCLSSVSGCPPGFLQYAADKLAGYRRAAGYS